MNLQKKIFELLRLFICGAGIHVEQKPTKVVKTVQILVGMYKGNVGDIQIPDEEGTNEESKIVDNFSEGKREIVEPLRDPKPIGHTRWPPNWHKDNNKWKIFQVGTVVENRYRRIKQGHTCKQAHASGCLKSRQEKVTKKPTVRLRLHHDLLAGREGRFFKDDARNCANQKRMLLIH